MQGEGGGVVAIGERGRVGVVSFGIDRIFLISPKFWVIFTSEFVLGVSETVLQGERGGCCKPKNRRGVLPPLHNVTGSGHVCP